MCWGHYGHGRPFCHRPPTVKMTNVWTTCDEAGGSGLSYSLLLLYSDALLPTEQTLFPLVLKQAFRPTQQAVGLHSVVLNTGWAVHT